MKNIETERKFLVDKAKWSLQQKPVGTRYIQGYLSIDAYKIVRVRVAGDKAFITIKGKPELLSRPEYEYAIPPDDARALIEQFAPTRIEKVRTRIPIGDFIWEVDEFQGENAGLLMAEIELENPEQPFEKPTWIGEEVTDDPRYYNANLSLNPFRSWK